MDIKTAFAAIQVFIYEHGEIIGNLDYLPL